MIFPQVKTGCYEKYFFNSKCTKISNHILDEDRTSIIKPLQLSIVIFINHLRGIEKIPLASASITRRRIFLVVPVWDRSTVGGGRLEKNPVIHHFAF